MYRQKTLRQFTLAYLTVAIVTPRPIIRKIIARAKNKIPLPRANSGPTDDTLRQCGHLARALFSVLNWKIREKYFELTTKQI